MPIEDPGPVIMFVGEGGDANVLRRVRAVAEARGVDAEALPIHVCARAPHLTNHAHLELIRRKVDEVCPRLVTLDPLYLSARGANGADLYGMGETLETVQRLWPASQ